MNPNDTEKVHWFEPEYGTPYWRKFAFCSDGSVIIGCGLTTQAAEMDAKLQVAKKEEYLALPDVDRLKILVEGDLLDTDKKAAIQIMAKLLIQIYELQTSLHPQQQ